MSNQQGIEMDGKKIMYDSDEAATFCERGSRRGSPSSCEVSKLVDHWDLGQR